MAFGPSLSPSQRFRLALLLPSSSLAHLQRLAQKLPDLRNTDPSTRQTSLALAVAANRFDVASWLVEEGHEEGEISRDTLGETCLHIAAAHGYADMLQLYLSQYSFVLDWVNSRGATPLHVAAMKGEVECAQVLIEAGAELDAPDLQGNTPIHYASSWGHINVVKLLIDMGCQHGAKNNDDFTAADYAFSFAGLKALEDYARAHFELSKRQRQRKHSRAARPDFSPNPSLGTRSLSDTAEFSTAPSPPVAGLGLGLSSSISSSYLSQSTRVETPPPGARPGPPTLSPALQRTSSTTSGIPSPSSDSIRKISLRDADAIDSFRVASPSVPPPAPSASFDPTTLARSRSESGNSIQSMTSSTRSTTAPPSRVVSRSRSVSSALETGDSARAPRTFSSDVPHSTPPPIIVPPSDLTIDPHLASPMSPIAPPPPSPGSKPMSRVGTASSTGTTGKKDKERGRRGSGESSAPLSGGGRVARALGLGKKS